MTELRYDPSRLAPMRARAAAALQHLLRASAEDPAASSALRVSAQVRANLKRDWLPAIDRLMASDAMLAWTSGGPAWMRGLSGSALGRELAEQASALTADLDDHRVASMVEALRLAADDGEALATFVRELGAEQLLLLLANADLALPDQTALPAALRDALVGAATSGALPSSYGADLVRGAVRAHEQLDRTGGAAVALSYLFHGGQLPTAFLVEAASTMVEEEQRYAADVGGDEPGAGWAMWMTTAWRSTGALRDDFADLGEDGLTWMIAADPMYALLGQLGRDGRAGRAVLTDRRRAAYLFGERDVLADGGTAIVAAAAEAAAGSDVTPGASPSLLHDASLVASGFVNHFGAANARQADRDAAVPAAQLVGAHVFAIDVALTGHDVTDDERIAALPPAARAALEEAGVLAEDGRVRGRVMAVGELHHDVLGPAAPARAAVFQAEALVAVLELAAGSDAAAEHLRGAVAIHQRALAGTAAARVARGELVDANRYLDEVTLDAARLEGRFVEIIGHQAERRGRDADAVAALWIGAAGEGVEQGGRLLGEAGSAVVGAVVEPAGDRLGDALAGAEDRAEADADELARLAGEQLAYVWYRELHDAGVIAAALPVDLAPGGRLPSYTELVRRVLERPGGDWTMERVLNELDVATSAAGVDLDGRALRESLAVAQLPHYQELSD